MGVESSSPAGEPRRIVLRTPTPVTLHVYDLGDGLQVLNRVLAPFGTGAFHCGVEVHGEEWSFRGSGPSRHGGVFSSAPSRCDGHAYSESIYMGDTILSQDEVLRLIKLLRKDWPGLSYNLIRRNCCHFSDLLCMNLGCGSIPTRIKSLAATGAALLDTGKCLNSQTRQILDCTSAACCCSCCCSSQDSYHRAPIQMASCYEPHVNACDPIRSTYDAPRLNFDSRPPRSLLPSGVCCRAGSRRMNSMESERESLKRFDWIEAGDHVIGLELM